jgi:hypothetical protein
MQRQIIITFWGSGASSQHFSDRESGGREKSRAFRMRCATIPSELWFFLTVGIGGNRRNVAMKHLAIN